MITLKANLILKLFKLWTYLLNFYKYMKCNKGWIKEPHKSFYTPLTSNVIVSCDWLNRTKFYILIIFSNTYKQANNNWIFYDQRSVVKQWSFVSRKHTFCWRWERDSRQLVGCSITKVSGQRPTDFCDCVHCVLFSFRLVASMKASVHFVDTNNARSDFTACGVITHSIHRTWCCVSQRSRHRRRHNKSRPRLRLPLAPPPPSLYDVLIKSYFYVLLRSLRLKHCLD